MTQSTKARTKFNLASVSLCSRSKIVSGDSSGRLKVIMPSVPPNSAQRQNLVRNHQTIYFHEKKNVLAIDNKKQIRTVLRGLQLKIYDYILRISLKEN